MPGHTSWARTTHHLQVSIELARRTGFGQKIDHRALHLGHVSQNEPPAAQLGAMRLKMTDVIFVERLTLDGGLLSRLPVVACAARSKRIAKANGGKYAKNRQVFSLSLGRCFVTRHSVRGQG